MNDRIIVIGGGLAGLAAAEALSARGRSVLLLESRGRLGGRASSFEDRRTGKLIDNCQHVVMGCCTNFEQFCRRAGLESFLRSEPTLHFIGLDRRDNRMAVSRLPAPFHLMRSARRLSYLDHADRWALARGLSALARAEETDLRGVRFDNWLARHGQTENSLNRFWHVVLVSALAESLDRIDAAHARKVFVDGFLANREGWQMFLPRVPLDELYGARLKDHLAGQGAEIRQGCRVRRLLAEGDRIAAAELRGGEVIPAEEFVLAVPHYHVRALLPAALADRPELRRLEELETSPITSVHLWFDRPIMDLPHAVLVDRLSQWIFNRTDLGNMAPGFSHREAGSRTRQSLADFTSDLPKSGDFGYGSENGYYYQVVISASRELEDMTPEETIDTVCGELRDVWPSSRSARLLNARRISERRAVFSVTPGCDALRLPQQSPIANLQFAGDWTRTGWPATMEGAVRSGYLAAENILRRQGKVADIVAPDLPIARISRWLWGLTPSNGQT